jgi:2-amino-4-hydroxy-6-hydroxymethyldihydropteridine diphosphokinase
VAKQQFEVFIGVGTNVGNRLENIKNAYDELKAVGIHCEKSASIYESEPWGFEAQTTFYNTVFQCFTTFDPMKLLTTLKNVEKKMGRSNKQQNGYESRIIDLDILLYNDEIFNNALLTIPHAYLLERQFVTLPLHELVEARFFNSLKQQLPSILKSKKEGVEPFVVHKPILINQ